MSTSRALERLVLRLATERSASLHLRLRLGYQRAQRLEHRLERVGDLQHHRRHGASSSVTFGDLNVEALPRASSRNRSPSTGRAAATESSTHAAARETLRNGATPLSKAELRELYETAMRIALGLMKSRTAAEQLVSDAFEALLTTRRWDKSKGPLDRHLFGVLTSIRSNRFKSKADARAADVGKEYQREIGMAAQSPEERMLSHSAAETDRTSAEGELDELARSVAHLPMATKVLQCLRASADGEKKKPAEVAAELGLPREEVYMANKLLREHLGRIRARRGEGGGEDG